MNNLEKIMKDEQAKEKNMNDMQKQTREAGKDMPGRKSGIRSLVVLVILAAAIILALRLQQKPVRPAAVRPGTSASETKDYSILIRTHADQAGRRNANAWNAYTADLDRIIGRHRPVLEKTAREAATGVASYTSCGKVVGRLAVDMVKGTHHTEAYIESTIKPFTAPVLAKMEREVRTAFERLESDLKSCTLIMAKDLAALAPDSAAEQDGSGTDRVKDADFRNALHNLGFRAIGSGVAVALDFVAIRQMSGTVIKYITGLAGRIFAKAVAKTATAVIAPPADGPLPIGDAIAIGCVAWTACDIHDGQKKFEKEMRMALEKMMTGACDDTHDLAIRQGGDRIKAYQQMQDDIGSEMAVQLAEER